MDPLARRCDFVRLAEPSAQDMTAIMGTLRNAIARHHRVTIDTPVVASCLRRAGSLPGHFPAKAIRLLDAAAAHARLAGANAIGPEDIDRAARKTAGLPGHPRSFP
jgi:ATP-dependent Clp protease ATP-binding subunit ClpA